MVTVRRNNSYSSNNYTKIEKEDPREKSHREAQFLIYKSMKQVDQMVIKRSSLVKSTSSWLKLRMSKLKVKIGNKLFQFKKTMLICHMSKTKGGVCRHLMGHLRGFKRLFNGGGARGGASGRGGRYVVSRLPQPIFTI
ncbi:hypothetical protein vseg_017389 [Gypsophila vaccaria]